MIGISEQTHVGENVLENLQNDQNEKDKIGDPANSDQKKIERNDPDDRKYDKKKILLHWRDMPKHLQFNRYILTGYRPMLTPWGCITSLGYLHNETINIVTHAIPILYILLTVPQILPWSSADLRFLAWCHIAGILCPWVGSFLYHLFMNLEKGPHVYYRLLQADMLGIWVSQSFGAMPMIFATTYCLPNVVKSSLIFFYCLLSVWGLYKALTAWSPWERRLCFSLPFVMRICLWFLRLSKYGGGDPTAFSHVVLQVYLRCSVDTWRCNRSLARSREVASRLIRHVPEFSQHHAHLGSGSGLFHACSNYARPDVDVEGQVLRQF